MQSGFEQLIAAEQRLDAVVAAGESAALRLIDEAKKNASARTESCRAELARKITEVETHAAGDREGLLAELEAAAAKERGLFDRLDEVAIDRLATRVLDRVLDSLESEAEQ